jgi:hypothetical protein
VERVASIGSDVAQGRRGDIDHTLKDQRILFNKLSTRPT